MNYWIKLLIVLAIVIALLYLLRGRRTTLEQFTDEQNTFAQKVLTFFQTPNNYPGYVNMLIANNNTSPNLATMSTYNTFISKGNQLSISDILTQI